MRRRSVRGLTLLELVGLLAFIALVVLVSLLLIRCTDNDTSSDNATVLRAAEMGGGLGDPKIIGKHYLGKLHGCAESETAYEVQGYWRGNVRHGLVCCGHVLSQKTCTFHVR